MTLRLRPLAASLVVSTLLLSTLGCSKKEEATPTTGSYKLDGVTKNCTVTAVASTIRSASFQYLYNNLRISLTTDNSSKESFELQFNKLQSDPNSAYTLSTMSYFSGIIGSNGGISYNNNVTALTSASNGRFSGTFSGSYTTTSGAGVTHIITDGVFTGVRP